MKKKPPKEAIYKAKDHIILFMKKRGGLVAFSCFHL
jgi:hypothetical protein